MTIDERKNWLHQLVDQTDDEDRLEEAVHVLSVGVQPDFMDDLTDEQRAGLEQARQQARQGEGTPLADFKREMVQKYQWLRTEQS